MGTIMNWYTTGGPLVLPLAVAGLLGLVILVERFSAIVLRARTHARPFMERVIALARADKIDEALKVCAEHESALPDLGLIILRSKANEDGDLIDVADVALMTVVPELTRRLSWLTTLSIVTLLLGVLGFVVNAEASLIRPGEATFAPVLAFALRPLGIGVLTAIPLLLGHAYLRQEAERRAGELQEFSARLVNALIDRPDVRLGHRE